MFNKRRTGSKIKKLKKGEDNINNILDVFKDICGENICKCGKKHELITKEIYIGRGGDTYSRLSDFIDANFEKTANGIIICDENTHKASEKLIDCLSERCRAIILCVNSFHADVSMIDEAKRKIYENENKFSFFIAAGSGTVHDITRVIANDTAKPFISFPTAPSVDGFVSGVAPVTINGMKITLSAVAPVALFADIKVICNAPKRLVASGAGDILGKYISLADWQIANLMIGEYICGGIIELEYAAVDKARGAINALGDSINMSDTELKLTHEMLCISLLEALVISGVCMQLVGNSRPASGAEHHIAHFLEMGMLVSFDGRLHGENVGTGSILCSEAYHRLAAVRDDSIIFARNPDNYEPDYALIKIYYKDLYDEIIKQNTPNELIKVTPEIFYSNLGRIKSIIGEIPVKDEFERLLKLVSGNELECETEETKELILKLAPYVRNRFTLLKLMRLIETY